MRNRLKEFRVEFNMTQTQIAESVGVTQPTYQRWETGAAPIPEPKLKKLAHFLGVDAAKIIFKHEPIEATFFDADPNSETCYYGEVAIHFRNGGDPLLLSISNNAYTNLHLGLQGKTKFVTVNSLANQTVSLRVDAISDLYFSSDDYEDHGPEHGTYKNHLNLQIPDNRDWEIIEAMACDSDMDEFDSKDVERVSGWVITEEQYDKLAADDAIDQERLASDQESIMATTALAFKTACAVTYQLSTGQKRDIDVEDREAMYEAFVELVEMDDEGHENNMILWNVSGSHRTIFINKDAIDYVILPTHQYISGRVDSNAAALDHMN